MKHCQWNKKFYLSLYRNVDLSNKLLEVRKKNTNITINCVLPGIGSSHVNYPQMKCLLLKKGNVNFYANQSWIYLYFIPNTGLVTIYNNKMKGKNKLGIFYFVN